MDYKAELASINNLLVMTHPTGEDILIVADAIIRIRSLLKSAASEESRGEESAKSV